MRQSTRVTPKTPQTDVNGKQTPKTELSGNKNMMKRVAYKTKSKPRVTIVPKVQVTLNRNTPQKAPDMLRVRRSPTNPIDSASKMVNQQRQARTPQATVQAFASPV